MYENLLRLESLYMHIHKGNPHFCNNNNNNKNTYTKNSRHLSDFQFSIFSITHKKNINFKVDITRLSRQKVDSG